MAITVLVGQLRGVGKFTATLGFTTSFIALPSPPSLSSWRPSLPDICPPFQNPWAFHESEASELAALWRHWGQFIMAAVVT